MAGPPQIIPAEDALTVFTDGASLPTPRRGGIGIHFVHTDHLGNETNFDLAEAGYAGATNNQMELQAVVTALRTVDGGRLPPHMLEGISKVEIYADSSYVAGHMNSAIYEWPSNGWKTRAGAPVLNADLWKELVKQYKRLRQTIRVEIKWGKGHSTSNRTTRRRTSSQSSRRGRRRARSTGPSRCGGRRPRG